MLNYIAADAVVLIHFAFVLFVVFGGFLVLKWPSVMWLHLPCVAWGVWVELTGRICPLTPLENQLRMAAGLEGYSGGFIEHYIIPLLYPAEFSRDLQLVLGAVVVGVNLLIYTWLTLRWIRKRRSSR